MSVWAQMEPLTFPALNGRGKLGAAKPLSQPHYCLLSMKPTDEEISPPLSLVICVVSFPF